MQEGHEDAPVEICSDCSTSVATTCPDPQASMFLEDDKVGDAIELAALLHGLDDVMATITECWRKAAIKRSSVMIPACVTNVGMIMIKDIARRISTVNESGSLEAIHEACHILEAPDRDKDFGPPLRWHQVLDDLRDAWRVIQCYRKETMTIEVPTAVWNAVEFIQPGGSDASRKTAALHLLMANVLEELGVAALHPCPSTLPPIGIRESPFINEMKQVMGFGESHTSELLSSISLILLYTTHQAYLHPNATQCPLHEQPCEKTSCSLRQNPRIDALRYTSNILKSLRSLLDAHPPVPDSTFPCRCNQTLAFHIEVLRIELEKFVTSRCWDLLHQSPWMAGCQMLDVMHRASYYGSKLLRYRNFVGATIHVYNALHVADPDLLTPIPVLEAVCEELKGVFFAGGSRPQRNFYKSYVRFLGGRLRFQKGHSRQRTQDTWCMAIPGHAARESSGLGIGINEGPKQKTELWGLLPRLARSEYTIDKDSWQEVCEHCGKSQQINGSSAKDVRKRRFELDKVPCSYLLTSLESAVTDELDSCLPLIRLDVFKLYATCVTMVEKVSKFGYDGGDEGGVTIRCLCFVEHLMAAAERKVRAKTERVENRIWKKEEKLLVELIAETLNDVFGEYQINKGKDLSEGLKRWRWDF